MSSLVSQSFMTTMIAMGTIVMAALRLEPISISRCVQLKVRQFICRCVRLLGESSTSPLNTIRYNSLSLISKEYL